MDTACSITVTTNLISSYFTFKLAPVTGKDKLAKYNETANLHLGHQHLQTTVVVSQCSCSWPYVLSPAPCLCTGSRMQQDWVHLGKGLQILQQSVTENYTADIIICNIAKRQAAVLYQSLRHFTRIYTVSQNNRTLWKLWYFQNYWLHTVKFQCNISLLFKQWNLHDIRTIIVGVEYQLLSYYSNGKH